MNVTRNGLKPLVGKRIQVTKTVGAIYTGFLNRIGIEGLTLSQVSIFNKYLGASTDQPIANRIIPYIQIKDIKEI